ncbi:hypothetical protein AWB91_20285 [Mycobacterium paraense]|uniref:Alpha/beta hydrolase n=1 Tax=Mycobacterium paraense TaxID=767916 RepID=A0ABX3VLU6_9MYCO|nr:hypothetical protein [Mycobacterium paraense]ORW30604.1 hypothetical protein AWB91_20285 [Mycobacterium paraense]ORW38888.1 hypothetical protein AWB88_20470 [Mycobacterium paraense]
MATIVLVHGIAQEQSNAKALESIWTPALARGVANSGNQQLADRIGSDKSDGIEARMAFYGGLFAVDGVQGDAVDLDTERLPAELEDLTERLAITWLEAAASSAADPDDRRQAQHDLAVIRGEVVGEVQGLPGKVGRPALRALAGQRWFAPFGFGLASRFVWKSLTQVTRYLTDDHIRTSAQNYVLELIGPETRMVVGHSLGSVVAYQALHRAYEGRLSGNQQLTLITLGSPLGLQNIIYDCLPPPVQGVPPATNRWENLAAEDDLVAAELDLTDLFPPLPGSPVKVCNHLVDTGSQPHEVTHYLIEPPAGRIVGESLAGI